MAANALKKALGLDANSISEKAVDRTEAEIVAEYEDERRALRPALEEDVGALLEESRQAYRDRSEFLQSREYLNCHNDTGHNRAIEMSRIENEKSRRAEEARDTQSTAQRRTNELDAILGASAEQAASAGEWRSTVAAIEKLIEHRHRIVAGQPALVDAIAVAERQRDAARDANLERLSGIVERGELDANDTTPELDDLERSLASKRGMLKRSQEIIQEDTAAIEAKRATLDAIRGRYVMATARRADLRWLAVCRLIRPELEAVVAAKSVAMNPFPPELPRIDELAVQRIARELLGPLTAAPTVPPVPAEPSMHAEAAMAQEAAG